MRIFEARLKSSNMLRGSTSLNSIIAKNDRPMPRSTVSRLTRSIASLSPARPPSAVPKADSMPMITRNNCRGSCTRRCVMKRMRDKLTCRKRCTDRLRLRDPSSRLYSLIMLTTTSVAHRRSKFRILHSRSSLRVLFAMWGALKAIEMYRVVTTMKILTRYKRIRLVWNSHLSTKTTIVIGRRIQFKKMISRPKGASSTSVSITVSRHPSIEITQCSLTSRMSWMQVSTSVIRWIRTRGAQLWKKISRTFAYSKPNSNLPSTAFRT